MFNMDSNENENNSFKKSFKDFVITMCRNGVQHTQSLQIQATISITIDEKSVEIIQLNEKFYSNEYFPERMQIEPQEVIQPPMGKMRGGITPRAKRGMFPMRRTPRSLPAKIRLDRTFNAMASDSGIVPKRLNFHPIRPHYGGRMSTSFTAPQPAQRPRWEAPVAVHQNEEINSKMTIPKDSSMMPIICLDEEEEFSSNYQMNMKVRKVDPESFQYTDDPYTDDNSDIKMSTISNTEYSSSHGSVQGVKSELKMETAYDSQGCAYCELEFQNMRALRTHIRQAHADVRVTSTNQNSFDDANIIE